MSSYTVSSNDSQGLSAIALRNYGDAQAWSAIYHYNRDVIGGDANLIKPGQELQLPPREYVEKWMAALESNRLQVDSKGQATGEIPELQRDQYREPISREEKYDNILTQGIGLLGWDVDAREAQEISDLANALAMKKEDPCYRIDPQTIDPQIAARALSGALEAQFLMDEPSLGTEIDPQDWLGFDPPGSDNQDRQRLSHTIDSMLQLAVSDHRFGRAMYESGEPK